MFESILLSLLPPLLPLPLSLAWNDEMTDRAKKGQRVKPVCRPSRIRSSCAALWPFMGPQQWGCRIWTVLALNLLNEIVSQGCLNGV